MSRELTAVYRRYSIPAALPYDVEIHPMGCDCSACEPHTPSAPRQLTAAHPGKLAVAAAVSVTAIMLEIDPHGTAAALLSCFGGR